MPKGKIVAWKNLVIGQLVGCLAKKDSCIMHNLNLTDAGSGLEDVLTVTDMPKSSIQRLISQKWLIVLCTKRWLAQFQKVSLLIICAEIEGVSIRHIWSRLCLVKIRCVHQLLQQLSILEWCHADSGMNLNELLHSDTAQHVIVNAERLG